MEVAQEKRLLRAFALDSPDRTSIFAMTEARRRTYVLLSIVGVAIILRLYGIAEYPLEGDEYGSIIEAKWLGLNWNSIIYSTVMHFWVRFGASEIWLRLPAMIFGVATVPLIFKIGEKLGGWRTGVVAAVLAATSPFNIYHSQEVRFYSLFMLAAATFMLATVSYVDSKRSARNRFSIILAAALLLVSHFVGIIALYAQGSAAFLAAKKRRLQTALAMTVGIALLIFGVPMFPPIRNQILHLYQILGNGWSADLSATRLSLLGVAKLAFAGYTLIFGYHVYPFRLALVVPAVSLCAFLLIRGAVELKKQRKWTALPFTYLAAAIGIYIVLDSVAGRVAAGVSPRHAAFVWPAFIVLLSLSLTSFTRITFQILLVAVLAINLFSLWFGWQKDWTYGVTHDYRAAGSYVAAWANNDAAMIVDGRAYEALDRYFPRNLPLVTSRPGSAEFDQLPYRRLIVVSSDWRPEERQQTNDFLTALNSKFAVIDGRVDYPLFEYVLERKPSSANGGNALGANGQVAQPISIYPIEFQDLKLPINVSVGGTPMKVIGAYSLPSSDGQTEIGLPLSHPQTARSLVLLTNTVGLDQTRTGEGIAEVIVENQAGVTSTFPLRIDRETASWSGECSPVAECKTAFQWHKRMAMTGQNSFPDAWRDFQAGLHAAVLNLPPLTEVRRVSIRYLADSGHLYLWGISLPA